MKIECFESTSKKEVINEAVSRKNVLSDCTLTVAKMYFNKYLTLSYRMGTLSSQ